MGAAEMTTLYKRATPPQQRILRIVEGAIKNAADAHEEIKVSPRHRRSIAKRATGTLTAQFAEVLAATRCHGGAEDKRRSSKVAGRHFNPRRNKPEDSPFRLAGFEVRRVGAAGDLRPLQGLPLLGLAERLLWRSLKPLKEAGDAELFEAVRQVVYIIGLRRKMQRKEAA